MLIALFELSSQSQSGSGAAAALFFQHQSGYLQASLFSRRTGFGHGAVKTVLTGLGVRVDEINRTIDHLIRAQRRPVHQIARGFNVEPRAVWARSVHMERVIRQDAAGRAGAVAVDNNGRCLGWKTDDIIRICLEFENHGAGDIGRSIIDGYDRNLRAALAGRNNDRTGQRNIIHSVGCSAANSVLNRHRIVRCAKTMHRERRIFGSAICEETEAGNRRDPIAPGAEAIGQPKPRPAISALNGNGIGRNDIDYRRAIGGRRRCR